MFPTAEAAEIHFYEAFSNFDIDQMMLVWAGSAESTCIHPGGTSLRGRDNIKASWGVIFDQNIKRRFTLRTIMKAGNSEVQISLVEENISVDGRTPAAPPVYATNIYKCFNDNWLMILHHASAAPILQFIEDATLDTFKNSRYDKIH